MVDIRTFTTGQLYGIKVRDWSVRTGVKVACAGAFLPELRGFRVNMISSEGVVGTQQALRFERREDAERFIEQHHSDFGYNANEMAVMNMRGTAECQKIPVANFDAPGWVNIRKWDATSDSALRKMKEVCPEYFDPDSQEGLQNNSQYRGFRF